MTDWELLRRYVDGGEHGAFGELVRRHVDMVYSAARRRVRDAHLAEDVTQGVFVLLATKGREISGETATAGVGAWLHRVAHFTSLSELRDLARRGRHERE